MERHLNYRQASELLGIKVGTLYSLVHRRKVPHIRLGTRLVRFSPTALAEWLEAHSVLPTHGDEPLEAVVRGDDA